MTPQLIFQIRNIADFGVELRIIIRNSAIAQSRDLRLQTKKSFQKKKIKKKNVSNVPKVNPLATILYTHLIKLIFQEF